MHGRLCEVHSVSPIAGKVPIGCQPDSAIGGQWLSLTTVMAKMKCLFAELAGPNPSAVEAALADVAVLAWADWCRCVQKRETLEDCSIRLASYHDGRVDRAHKRLVRSLRALAAVRKIDLTAVQINIDGSM